MTKSISIASLVALSVLLLSTACGPDSELVASGKAHSCEIQALEARIKANPQDKAAQAELRSTAEDLKAVIDSADPGDRAELSSAIRAEVAKGCP